MDAQVRTAQTKAHADTMLLAKTLTTQAGEEVFLLLQIEAEESATKSLQKECLNIVQHALLETEGETAHRLDSTLKELNGLMKGLLLSKSIRDVHAIVAVVDDTGALHVSHAGRAEAYVVRAGVASQITEYTKGKPSPVFVHIASGHLEAKDIIVLSTQRLLRTVTPAQLAKLAGQPEGLINDLKRELEAEDEQAALATLLVAGGDKSAPRQALPSSRSRARGRRGGGKQSLTSALSPLKDSLASGSKALLSKAQSGEAKDTLGRWMSMFQRDLQSSERSKRTHLLLLAGVVVAFLVVWATINLTTLSQHSQTKAELEELVNQINEDIRQAENRRLTGNVDAANAILARAEERTKQVMNNESGFFRTDALDLFDRIRAKGEEINNIIRLSPRVVANLSARNPDVKAQGFIGLPEEEFLVYDRQDLYRVIRNSVEDPDRLSDEELVLDGIHFERYQTNVFQMTSNSVIEIIAGQPSNMKTEDPAGWITGKDIEAYLRFLYVLSPENNQIYKYERLSNRYAPPAEYNINGDLAGALDMTIDGNIYIIKEDGTVVKLLRGETQPFVIRHAPDDLLDGVTKVFKVFDGNIYFLDPTESRVVVVTDGGATGESTYVKQFVLEGDQVVNVQDLYVDPEETRLYVMDEKRVYKIDLAVN